VSSWILSLMLVQLMVVTLVDEYLLSFLLLVYSMNQYFHWWIHN
jgi:hypothetical protein